MPLGQIRPISDGSITVSISWRPENHYPRLVLSSGINFLLFTIEFHPEFKQSEIPIYELVAFEPFVCEVSELSDPQSLVSSARHDIGMVVISLQA